MGLFGDDRDKDQPTLLEAWQMLSQRMGATVEEINPRSIRAQGTVCGRGFFVAIEGGKKGSDFFRSFAYNPRGSRAHVRWRSELAVGCTNPRQLAGTIESFVDINDPRWSPGAELNLCRVVTTDPPLLGVTPREKAEIASWNWRVEFEGLLAIAEAMRNSSPAMANRALAGPANYAQIPELAQRGLARVQQFFVTLNERLHGEGFVAAGRFSVADITAVVAVDFARVVKVKPGEQHPHILRWRAAMAQRPPVAL